MQRNCIDALAQAIVEEIGKESPHSDISVSSHRGLLLNGIEHCGVKIQCKAGCGWHIDAYGEDSEMLAEKALQIEKVIRFGGFGVFRSITEMLRVLFPELESNPARGVPIEIKIAEHVGKT